MAISFDDLFGNKDKDSVDVLFEGTKSEENVSEEESIEAVETVEENKNVSSETTSQQTTNNYFDEMLNMASKIQNTPIEEIIKEKNEKLEEKNNEIKEAKKRGRPKGSSKTEKEVKEKRAPKEKKDKEEKKAKLLSPEYRKNFKAENYEDAEKLISFNVGRHSLDDSIEITKEDGTINSIDIPKRDILYRSDTGEFLGDVSSSYTIMPHNELITSVKLAMSEIYPDMNPRVSCTINDNGSAMWYSFIFDSVKDYTHEISKGDLVSAVLTFGNSYDRSVPCVCKLAAEREVSKSYLVSGVKAYKVALKHSSFLSVKFFEKIATKMMGDFINLCKKWEGWALQECSAERAKMIMEYISNDTIMIPNTFTTLISESIDSGFGSDKNSNFTGTRWSLYNLISHIATSCWSPLNTNNIDLARLKVSHEIAPYIANDSLFNGTDEDFKLKLAKLLSDVNKRKESVKERREIIKTNSLNSVNVSD